MKLLLISFSLILILWGCSTSPNNNGESTTTVVPLAPNNLTGSVVSNSSVNLSWVDNSTNETGFKIERRLNGSIQFVLVGTVNTDVTGFIDTALTSNTSYEYRVYSYNTVGNSLTYSNVLVLTTSGSNTNLSSVTICNQVWATQNSNLSHYKNGDSIPHVTDANQWSNLTTGAWCWYNNDSANYGQYGKLYNWYAVNDPRGLAPSGWHIPVETEWNKLVKCLDTNADTICQGCVQSIIAGGKLKEIGTSHWFTPNLGATNSSGFSSLPGGLRDNNGLFGDIGQKGYLWSSKEYSSSYAWYRYMTSFTSDINRYDYFKSYGFSVRFIKD
jgi:hypothetical protein